MLSRNRSSVLPLLLLKLLLCMSCLWGGGERVQIEAGYAMYLGPREMPRMP